jgi:hypothetical protein
MTPRSLGGLGLRHLARASSPAWSSTAVKIRAVDLIKHALTRKRLLAGLGLAGGRPLEFVIAEEGSPAAPYIVLSGGAARKVDQYAARKVIQFEGGSFYVLLITEKEGSACGNMGISCSVRDFDISTAARVLTHTTTFQHTSRSTTSATTICLAVSP